jgi:hypothetical protein
MTETARTVQASEASGDWEACDRCGAEATESFEEYDQLVCDACYWALVRCAAARLGITEHPGPEYPLALVQVPLDEAVARQLRERRLPWPPECRGAA